MGFSCISAKEAYAEKFRAALTRREAAIRDYFDIDYAIRRMGVNHEEQELAGMVRRKLAVPGNDLVHASTDRLNALRQQLKTELKPVLRKQDYEEFDLDRAFSIVAERNARVRS